MVASRCFSEARGVFLNSIFPRSRLAECRSSAYLKSMANWPMARASLCAWVLLCAGCSSDAASGASSAAGQAGTGSGASSGGSSSVVAGASASGSSVTNGGAVAAHPGTGGAPAGGAGSASAGESSAAPPAVDGRSIYTLECHGDSKDCSLGTVPCFGVGTQMPSVAAGWACANRCTSNADCSDAPSGAEAQAGCVSFSSASHCMLVCKNENKSFACPDGMSCYVPLKSPIGYCLWQ
jgi:hypothetical protein